MQSAIQSLDLLDFAYATAPDGPAINADVRTFTSTKAPNPLADLLITTSVSFDDVLDTMNLTYVEKGIKTIEPLIAHHNVETFVERLRDFLGQAWDVIAQRYKLYCTSVIQTLYKAIENGVYKNHIRKLSLFNQTLMSDLLRCVYPEMIQAQTGIIQQNNNALSQQLVTLEQTYKNKIQAMFDALYSDVAKELDECVQKVTDYSAYTLQLETTLTNVIHANHATFQQALKSKPSHAPIKTVNVSDYLITNDSVRADIANSIRRVGDDNVVADNQLSALKARLAAGNLSPDTIVSKTAEAIKNVVFPTRYYVKTFSFSGNNMFDKDHLQIKVPIMKTAVKLEKNQLVKIYIRYHHKAVLHNSGQGTCIISVHANNGPAVCTQSVDVCASMPVKDVMMTNIFYEMPFADTLTVMITFTCQFPHATDNWTCTLTPVNDEQTCVVLAF